MSTTLEIKNKVVYATNQLAWFFQQWFVLSDHEAAAISSLWDLHLAWQPGGWYQKNALVNNPNLDGTLEHGLFHMEWNPETGGVQVHAGPEKIEVSIFGRKFGSQHFPDFHFSVAYFPKIDKVAILTPINWEQVEGEKCLRLEDLWKIDEQVFGGRLFSYCEFTVNKRQMVGLGGNSIEEVLMRSRFELMALLEAMEAQES